MSTSSFVPRLKFTYAQRSSRLKSLTYQDSSSGDDHDGDSEREDHHQNHQHHLKRNRSSSNLQSASSSSQQTSTTNPLALPPSSKRKKPNHQSTRSVSNRLSTNSTSLQKLNPIPTQPLDHPTLSLPPISSPKSVRSLPKNSSQVAQHSQHHKSPRSTGKRQSVREAETHPSKALTRQPIASRTSTRKSDPQYKSSSSLPVVPSASFAGPSHSNINDHQPKKAGSPSISPLKSPYPAQVDPSRDHSDIFSILDAHQVSDDPKQSTAETTPRKVRIALMGGKSNSRSGVLSPSISSDSSRPPSPIINPSRLFGGRTLSSSSATQLFGLSSTVKQPLMRHKSADFPPIAVNHHETINTANLVSLFAGGNAVKKTYGAQRTFKNDENEMKLLLPSSTPASKQPAPSSSTGDSLRLMSSSKRFKPRETYSELRRKWGVDEDDEPIVAQRDIQTIDHQRASGSSKRFADELSYFIEGLVSPGPAQSPDLTLKRSTAVELIKKFKDHTFLDELRSNGLIEHVYHSFRSAGAGDGDLILDHALLIFIAVMCCGDQRLIEPVLRITPKNSKDVLTIASDCLQVLASVANDNPLQAPPQGRSTSRRKSQLACKSKLMSQIQEVVQESMLSKHFSGPSSSSLLALFSLARIAVHVPRPGLFPQRLIVQSSAFVTVINCLKVYSQELQTRFEKLPSNQTQDFSVGDGEEVLKHVGYCMDTIEACTVCEEDALNSIDSFRDSLSSTFGSLISICHTLARHDERRISMRALDILIGCLRTMVNLTNFNPIWTQRLATRSVSEAICGLFSICREGYHQTFPDQGSSSCILSEDPKGKRTRSSRSSQRLENKVDDKLDQPDSRVNDVVFDLLCVSLGLLANFLDQSTDAKALLRESRIPGTGLDSLDSSNGFEELIRLYLDPPCGKSDEKKFIRGSISGLINSSLLGHETEGSSEDYQGQNEAEMILRMKKIMLEATTGSICWQSQDDDEEKEDERELIDTPQARRLGVKNRILKRFFDDLKAHSAVLSPPLDDHHLVHLNLKRLQAAWTRMKVELI